MGKNLTTVKVDVNNKEYRVHNVPLIVDTVKGTVQIDTLLISLDEIVNLLMSRGSTSNQDIDYKDLVKELLENNY